MNRCLARRAADPSYVDDILKSQGLANALPYWVTQRRRNSTHRCLSLADFRKVERRRQPHRSAVLVRERHGVAQLGGLLLTAHDRQFGRAAP
jgi:hypothetical protein